MSLANVFARLKVKHSVSSVIGVNEKKSKISYKINIEKPPLHVVCRGGFLVWKDEFVNKQFYDPFYVRISTGNEKVDKKIRNHSERFDKYFKKYLEELQLEVVDLTNQPYQSELPIEPMNLDQFNGDKPLIIEAMVEPTIKVKDSIEILQKGKVYLKEVE